MKSRSEIQKETRRENRRHQDNLYDKTHPFIICFAVAYVLACAISIIIIGYGMHQALEVSDGQQYQLYEHQYER